MCSNGSRSPTISPQNRIGHQVGHLEAKTSRASMARCWRSTKTRNTRRMRRCAIFRCKYLACAPPHTPSFRLPQLGVIWQLNLHRQEYLQPDSETYSWLGIDGDEGWYCWVCHQYDGARDNLGTIKARPSRQQKRGPRQNPEAHSKRLRPSESMRSHSPLFCHCALSKVEARRQESRGLEHVV